MNVRKIKLWLWTATAGLLLATAAAAVAGFVLPLEVPQVAVNDVRPKGPTTAPAEQSSLPPLHEFEGVWVKAHRGSLTPAPPPPPVQQVAAQPAQPARVEVPLTLEGWVGDVLAVVRTPDGQLWFKELGEEVNGVRLLSVAPGRARVQFQGQEDEITKPLDPPPGQY